jgi:hypothetical protein
MASCSVGYLARVSGNVPCYVKVLLRVDHKIDFVGEAYAMKIPKQGHYKDLLELQIKALAGLWQHLHVISLVGLRSQYAKFLL